MEFLLDGHWPADGGRLELTGDLGIGGDVREVSEEVIAVAGTVLTRRSRSGGRTGGCDWWWPSWSLLFAMSTAPRGKNASFGAKIFFCFRPSIFLFRLVGLGVWDS